MNPRLSDHFGFNSEIIIELKRPPVLGMYSRDVVITTVCATAIRANQSTTSGLDLRITTDDGANGVTGTEISVPSSNAAHVAGQEFCATGIGQTISDGTQIEIQVQTGSFCEAGIGCSGTGGGIEIAYEVWGYFL